MKDVCCKKRAVPSPFPTRNTSDLNLSGIIGHQHTQIPARRRCSSGHSVASAQLPSGRRSPPVLASPLNVGLPPLSR